MNICCLSFEKSKNDHEYERKYQRLKQFLASQPIKVHYYEVNSLQLSPCIGCFDCWVKTPGQCVHKDGFQDVLFHIINADLLLVVCPVYEGFIPAKLKMCFDRMIPLLHPYLELVNKEVHHRKRYSQYPNLGMIVDLADTKNEEYAILYQWARRVVLNLRSELAMFATLEDTLQTDRLDDILNLTKNNSIYA